MKSTALFGAVFAAITSLAASENLQKDDPAKKLQGTWQAVSWQSEGFDMPKKLVKTVKFVFSEGKFEFLGPEKVLAAPGKAQKGTFKIDVTNKPNTIDLTLASEDKGLSILGIYSLDDDTLKISLNDRGRKRPLDFEHKNEEGKLVKHFFVLKRSK
jgi:uncharacterized protein (TIGR03067 family)